MISIEIAIVEVLVSLIAGFIVSAFFFFRAHGTENPILAMIMISLIFVFGIEAVLYYFLDICGLQCVP